MLANVFLAALCGLLIFAVVLIEGGGFWMALLGYSLSGALVLLAGSAIYRVIVDVLPDRTAARAEPRELCSETKAAVSRRA